MTFKFSRSHQETRRTCPRFQYLRFYLDGTGYESAKLNVERSTGSLLHAIIAGVLKLITQNGETPPFDDYIDAAVLAAVADYKEEALRRGFDLDANGDQAFELQRQAALAEGMARAWMRIRLPQILERFRLLYVEEEWEVSMTEDITLMVRLDSVWEERSSSELWIMELKHTGWMSDDWLEAWRYDSQMLSQAWAVEQRFPDRIVGGVLIEVCYKGVKRKDEQTGVVTYYSPLVHGYLHKGTPPFDADELSYDSAMGRRKGWEKVDVWNWGTSKDWIALVPDEILTQQLWSIEVARSPEDQEVWRRQTILEQETVQGALSIVQNADEEMRQMALDKWFPANLNRDCFSNRFRKRCPMFQICFNGLNPADSYEFVKREPHHPMEHEDSD